jgi:hypothetical protein
MACMSGLPPSTKAYEIKQKCAPITSFISQTDLRRQCLCSLTQRDSARSGPSTQRFLRHAVIRHILPFQPQRLG